MADGFENVTPASNMASFWALQPLVFGGVAPLKQGAWPRGGVTLRSWEDT